MSKIEEKKKYRSEEGGEAKHHHREHRTQRVPGSRNLTCR